MRPAWLMAIAALALAGAAIACNFPGRATEDPGGRATSLAETAAAILTQTGSAPSAPQATSAPAELVSPPTNAPLPVPAATDTPVVGPTSTIVPSPAPTLCEDDSDFVEDVTVPDGTEFGPATAFTKTWRIKNSGTCVWDAAYRFVRIGGDALGAPDAVGLPSVVAPGDEVNLSVDFLAPAAAGTYFSRWRLEAPGGVRFGTRPFVEIVVTSG